MSRREQRIAELIRAMGQIEDELRRMGAASRTGTYAPPASPSGPYRSWQEVAHHNQRRLADIIRECGTRHVTHALSAPEPRKEAA